MTTEIFREIVDCSKQCVKSAMYHIGVTNNLLRFKSRGRALILTYHRLATKKQLAEKDMMPGMFVSDESFRMQMLYLRDHFKLINLDQMVSMIKSQVQWDEPLCAVTFDDGWYDVYEHAFPILKEYSVPATVFVVGDFFNQNHPDCFTLCFEIMTSGKPLPHDLTGIPAVDTLIPSHNVPTKEHASQSLVEIKKLNQEDFNLCFKKLVQFYKTHCNFKVINDQHRTLSWDELSEMQKCGLQVGYHSSHHYMLPQVPLSALEAELKVPEHEAKNYNIEFNRIFCYPAGQYNEDVMKALNKLGYEGAVSMAPGFNDRDEDPFKLKRINIHEGASSRMEDFIFLVGRN